MALGSFTGCKIDKAGNGYTLTATDAADNLTTPSAPSSPFNITVGPTFQLAFATSPSTTVGGDVFGTQPVVKIQDAGGNTVTTNSSTVSLSIGANPSGGTLSGCTGATSAGVATFSGCRIDKPGNGYTLSATDGTLQPGTSRRVRHRDACADLVPGQSRHQQPDDRHGVQRHDHRARPGRIHVSGD